MSKRKFGKAPIESLIGIHQIGVSDTRRTKIFAVFSKRTEGDEFGIIKWYGPWRKYIFETSKANFFDSDCLRMIADFCDEQTELQKTLKPGEGWSG